MASQDDHPTHCPLCGFEIRRHGFICERSCPFNKSCQVSRCPNCHYTIAEPSKFLRWVRKLFRSRRPALTSDSLLGLNELEEGEQSELVCLNCAQTSRRNRLAVYGLIPGSRIVLQQKHPTFVIQIGETELALEADIAKEIFVKRCSDDQPLAVGAGRAETQGSTSS